MDVRQLRYFLAVAQELHFGRAAERVHIAQSPLSRQIRQLEDTLGVQLFHRTKRQVALTEAGQALVAEAQAILDAMEQARHTAVQAQAGMIGRLRIGFTSSAVYTILPRILLNYRRSHPRVELILGDSALTSTQVEGLLDQTLDIGFLRPPVGAPAIGLLPIAHERLVVALPATHPLAGQTEVSLHQLAQESFIVFPRHVDSSLSTLIQATCLEAGFQMRCEQEARDIPTMIMLVASGVGLSLVPASARCVGVRDVVFRDLAGVGRSLQIALGWNRQVDSAVRDGFLAVAQAVLGDSQPHLADLPSPAA